MFIKYQHIEKLNTVETEGIQFGKCYIFPKIDGTNASVWADNNELKAGSRTRQLDLQQDNAGFYNSIIKNPEIRALLNMRGDWRLFGEWLVPHTLKTYRDDSWRKFYVFDVMIGEEYVDYEDYAPILENYGVEFIRPLATINNPSQEQLINLLNSNTYLIQDGMGAGEGIVIKNYKWRNKFFRQVWAKLVRSDFKDEHRKVMGVGETNGEKQIESTIVDKYVNSTLVDKVYAKIALEGWTSKKIPQLLNIVFYDLVKEETWTFIKQHKFPTINFKNLQYLTNQKIRSLKPELF